MKDMIAGAISINEGEENYTILFEARNLLTKFGTVETVKFLSKAHPSPFRNSKPRSSYV